LRRRHDRHAQSQCECSARCQSAHVLSPCCRRKPSRASVLHAQEQ
jgi:hypothetical protein